MMELYHMNDANDRLPTLDWLTLPILETALKHPNTCFSLGFYPRIRILQIPQNLLVQTFKALIFPSTQWPPSPRSPSSGAVSLQRLRRGPKGQECGLRSPEEPEEEKGGSALEESKAEEDGGRTVEKHEI